MAIITAVRVSMRLEACMRVPIVVTTLINTKTVRAYSVIFSKRLNLPGYKIRFIIPIRFITHNESLMFVYKNNQKYYR